MYISVGPFFVLLAVAVQKGHFLANGGNIDSGVIKRTTCFTDFTLLDICFAEHIICSSNGRTM